MLKDKKSFTAADFCTPQTTPTFMMVRSRGQEGTECVCTAVLSEGVVRRHRSTLPAQTEALHSPNISQHFSHPRVTPCPGGGAVMSPMRQEIPGQLRDILLTHSHSLRRVTCSCPCKVAAAAAGGVRRRSVPLSHDAALLLARHVHAVRA